MLTRRIDAALDALAAGLARIPALRDLYRPESRERAALDDLLCALQRADDELKSPRPRRPGA